MKFAFGSRLRSLVSQLRRGQLASRRSTAARIGCLGVVYGLGALVATSIPGVETIGSSVWPSAGIAQAAVILCGLRVWPGVLLGIQLFDIVNPSPTIPLLTVLGMAGAALQAVTAGWLFRRFRLRPSLDRVADALKFVLLGAVLAAQISCTLGALALCASGNADWADFWAVRWRWWLGDAMGVLVVAPPILMLARPPAARRSDPLRFAPEGASPFSPGDAAQGRGQRWRRFWQRRSLLEAAWLGLLVGTSLVVFAARPDAAVANYPLEYLPFPLVIWGALQFGQRPAVWASGLVSAIAIFCSARGWGPFLAKAGNVQTLIQGSEALQNQGAVQNQGVLFLQAFLGVMTITTLLLAAATTERDTAALSLQQSRQKYRELVQNANSIILRLDREGRVTFFNEFAQQFFGYSEAEMLGQSPLGRLIPETDAEGRDLTAMYARVLAHPDRFTRNENENIRRNGERVWVAWTNKPVFDGAGEFAGLLCIGTDISDRRRAELALQTLNEELEDRVERRTRELQQQKEKTEALLRNILPEAVADRLGDSQRTVADLFDDVTVLFADIVDFTTFAAELPPVAVVDYLNRIFSQFDRLADKHGLEKIKTIGDAYMVVGGLPVPRPDGAAAVAEMALEMRAAIANCCRRPDGKPFQIRIGIHAGSAAAGVIGIKKFSYDLWGDTVNVASRMESTGEAGRIQVTQTVRDRLGDRYCLERRGSVAVKGRGAIETYWLVGRRPDPLLALPAGPPPGGTAADADPADPEAARVLDPAADPVADPLADAASALDPARNPVANGRADAPPHPAGPRRGRQGRPNPHRPKRSRHPPSHTNNSGW